MQVIAYLPWKAQDIASTQVLKDILSDRAALIKTVLK